MHRWLTGCLLFLFASTALFAQQFGSVAGKVSATDGSALPGVTVEARSNVLPKPRVTTTDNNGDYRLPGLQPGPYTLTFSLAGMQTVTRRTDVIVKLESPVDVKMGVAGVSESITVSAQGTLVDRASTEIKSGYNTQEITSLPVQQDYRDLQKLIPGVMFTADATRGPSAGGSGQDNVYLFDGANVTMPLFGVLVAEPSTHDIAQVSIERGGAKAVDFDRAGGFLIDSTTKSGTNRFSGEVGYQARRPSWVAKQDISQNITFQQNRNWTTANLGGPLLPDRLFFYASYYRPIFTKTNQANLYGALPQYQRYRNEMFGKLTYTPTSSLLLNGSYRDSHDTETSGSFTSIQAPTTGNGSFTKLKIASLEGSWVPNARSYGSFKLYDFKNPGGGTSDFFAPEVGSVGLGAKLPIDQLDKVGRLIVPTPIAGNPTQNAFVQPYIDKYGYVQNGVHTGGGTVGFGQFAHDDDSFYRKSGQVAYDYQLGSKITHALHAGYQRYQDSEDRFQVSNGWGVITVPGGALNCPASACGTAKPAFFIANFSPQGTGQIPVIHSEFHSENVELNDSIRWKDWSFNAGVLASHDTLFGQGLAKANNDAGFIASPGSKYKMKDIPFREQIQPRLGATWAYNGQDTVYGSVARYNPAVTSLPRAASWDRNLVQSINAYFDQSGTLIGIDPVASSSGKLFVPGIKPRQTFEYMVGTAQQMTPNWSARVYGRYRKSDRFWEDTNNSARLCFKTGAGANSGKCVATSVPSDAPSNIPHDYYIPNLGTIAPPSGLRGAIGSGSTYVIAQLDGAFTKYYEATAESDFHYRDTFLRGSYTWSHYYGNFDQDNSTFNTANDQATFVGSSNIGDGAGRQIWNFKYGDLRGDRRNVVKLIGTQILPWRATAGAVFIYQSGQPYQLESYLPYVALTTSTSDTDRYAEPAGRRRSSAHNQMDLRYTQDLPSYRSVTLQLELDLYNIYNKQTPYNFETRVGSIGTCTPTSVDPNTTAPCPAGFFTTGLGGNLAYLSKAPFAKSSYDPRLYQLAARVRF